jgi:hypothetical protein
MFSILKWGAIFLACAGPPSAIAAVYMHKPNPDKLHEAIGNIGFYPITPPTSLRAPGSLYHVSSDGKYYSMLCEVQPERLVAVTRTSFTNNQVSSELRKARLGVSAELLRNIEATVNAKLVESVKLEIDDVEVLEVSLEDLAIIADELLRRGTCDQEVRRYLQEGDYICQGQQVLKATTKYTVAFDNTATAAGLLSRTAEVIKLTYDSDAKFEGGQIVSGKNLYYGMKLAPRCLYLPGHKSRRPPLNFWHRIADRVAVLDFLN